MSYSLQWIEVDSMSADRRSYVWTCYSYELMCFQQRNITLRYGLLLGIERFKCIGSMLPVNGELFYEIASLISAAWVKWRCTSCVLCDQQRIHESPKSKYTKI